MKLNIRQLLSGDPIRLRYVKRYSSYRVNLPENVAEHGFYVVLYAMFICEWLETRGHKIDYRKVLRYTVLHDLEECRTGDVPRAFKYSHPALKQIMDQSGQMAMVQIANAMYVEGNNRAVQVEAVTRLHRDWVLSKKDGIEGRVVDFVDFLSVLSYLIQEKESGNRFAREHAPSLWEYYERFNDSQYDEMRELIVDVGDYMKDVYSDVESRTKGSLSVVQRVHGAEDDSVGRSDDASLRVPDVRIDEARSDIRTFDAESTSQSLGNGTSHSSNENDGGDEGDSIPTSAYDPSAI